MNEVANDAAIDRLRRLVAALGWPGITEGTSYGRPAFKVGGKAFATLKTDDIVVLRCTFEEKDLLLEMAPEIYFQTDHFMGWPGLMARLEIIADDELSLRLANAWRERAPVSLAKRAQVPAAAAARR